MKLYRVGLGQLFGKKVNDKYLTKHVIDKDMMTVVFFFNILCENFFEYDNNIISFFDN